MQANIKNRNRVTKALAIGCVAALAVSSLALFTDRATGTGSATAGTLELALDEIVETSGNTQNWSTVAAASTDVKPGDYIDVNYKLTNVGNKSADVKEQIKLTSSVAMDANDMEFAIYKLADLEKNDYGRWVPKTGKTPVVTPTLSADGLTAIYELPQFILNGDVNDAVREIETNGEDAHVTDYVILFNQTADNEFMGAKLKMDYIAQAKQHRNTEASDWSTGIYFSTSTDFNSEELVETREGN